MVENMPKFIIGPELNSSNTECWIILSDYMYWGMTSTVFELDDWCEKHLSNGKDAIEGSIVRFVNEQEKMLFILRWS